MEKMATEWPYLTLSRLRTHGLFGNAPAEIEWAERFGYNQKTIQAIQKPVRGRKVDVGVVVKRWLFSWGGGEVLEEGAVRRRVQVTVAIEHCTVRPCFVADVSST